MEVALNQPGIRSAAFKAAADMAHELRTVVGALAAHRVAFDVLIDHLVGIEVGAVSRQKEQAHSGGVFLQPKSSCLLDLFVLIS